MKKAKIALLGLGNVGRGVFTILQQNKEEMSQETAEQILEAYSQDEKQLQEEMQRRKGGQRSLEKDW